MLSSITKALIAFSEKNSLLCTYIYAYKEKKLINSV